MSDYPKAFKELEDKIQSTESNGFPTKRNHAGNQQNYVPSGDEGGQYTYDGATGKPGDEDLEPPTPSSSSSGKDTKEPKGGQGWTDSDHLGSLWGLWAPLWIRLFTPAVQCCPLTFHPLDHLKTLIL